LRGDAKRIVGLDVGSTTVKAVVCEADGRVLWRDYRRHFTKQPEMALEFLERIEAELGLTSADLRLFLTGSGGTGIQRHVGGHFVQEVTAVSLAVEKLHPEVSSVVELGGQDAKIIVFKDPPAGSGGRKKKIPSMNDKCAGGTGAVIDKINAKLRIPAEALAEQGYDGIKLHHVAGKCGVFAETDINGLQKQGVPESELMASLFESIVQQNLSVLTRGHTLRPVVLLLGGPNTYIRGMVEAWRHNIPLMWEERRLSFREDKIDELIVVPESAQYFAALGAAEFAGDEVESVGAYAGLDRLREYLDRGREQEKLARGSRGLWSIPSELEEFKQHYGREPWQAARFEPGETVKAFVGLDGGSTSTKAVLLGPDHQLLAKAYRLSRGNPLADSVEMFRLLREQVEDQGARLEVIGLGTTGYAKDVLKDALGADTALVETVAHTKSALHYYDDVDVICDVGGQDIKIIILKNGQVKDFKLNTQCSAGNGYFLQSAAAGFGFDVEDYAEAAFTADQMPSFGYGCAVFMQSDIVDFQRQGWQAEEIMAGLAAVLPRNIWLYVSQIPNLATLGRRFVLQGGTQHNLAAVKAQVDFITERFAGQAEQPEVFVHRHTGESGAIGAALEAARLWGEGQATRFIGLDAVEHIEYETRRDESTRCYFCRNKCLRTFIDLKTKLSPADELTHVYKQGPEELHATRIHHPEAAAPETQRIIIATCEKGTVEDVADMREIKRGLDAVRKANPDLAAHAAASVFQSWEPARVAAERPRRVIGGRARGREAARERRGELRIGLPRALNMYSLAPLFTAYFESLGLASDNLVWSDYSSEKLYKAGAKRGAVDPCFPSKLGIPHVHNLLQVKHVKQALDLIFFPMIDDLPSELSGCVDHRSCPTVAVTPEAVKAAFTKESDLFTELGVAFLDTFLNPADPALLERQLFTEFGERLGLTVHENAAAVSEGYAALRRFGEDQRARGAEMLDRLEREKRIGIVMLGRPYHNDPGINHGILEEFQKRGFPIFTQQSLPLEPERLKRLFGEDEDPLSIADVWPNSYSENTSHKVFAAKYVARHPNLVALELSNFKCGHDAPVYALIESIIEASGTPSFSFKDIDENKPAGSIKIRVETIDYFLRHHREALLKRSLKRERVEEELAALEKQLRAETEEKPEQPAAKAAAASRRAS
jgi:predicted CoA-substrate-specific enzyme activase